jgi:hypothetical protein
MSHALSTVNDGNIGSITAAVSHLQWTKRTSDAIGFKAACS